MPHTTVTPSKPRVPSWKRTCRILKQCHYDQLRMLRVMGWVQRQATGSRDDPIELDMADELPCHPEGRSKEMEDMLEEFQKNVECPICLEVIKEGTLAILGCGHKYCKYCVQRLDKCALCRIKIKK